MSRVISQVLMQFRHLGGRGSRREEKVGGFHKY